MPVRPSTPRQLVEALQDRGTGAREVFWERLKAPIARLMDEMAARNGLVGDRERLTRNALHAAETWLRSRPTASFEGMSWAAFRAAVVLHIAKQAAQPFGEPGATGPPMPLRPTPAYQVEALFLPHEQVGRYWFGGDWFTGDQGANGDLWIMVADITGHGYCAYLLATALPSVWQACWNGGQAAWPADVLAAMHAMLEDSLPEGNYVECTLACLSPSGRLVVAPAGGTRFLLRQGSEAPQLVKLRGTWLGLHPPSAADQRTWQLADNHELVLGTDGLFDHLAERDEGAVLKKLGERAGASLFEALRELLRGALARGPQKDDITLIRLCRAPAQARSGAPRPSTAEAGDV